MEARKRERRAVIEAARKEGLPDGVFTMEMFNLHGRRLGPPPHAGAIAISEVFPDAPAQELRELTGAASALMGSAYDAGDTVLAKRETTQQVVARLKREVPGFSDGVYDRTISYGCFLAMW